MLQQGTACGYQRPTRLHNPHATGSVGFGQMASVRSTGSRLMSNSPDMEVPDMSQKRLWRMARCPESFILWHEGMRVKGPKQAVSDSSRSISTCQYDFYYGRIDIVSSWPSFSLAKNILGLRRNLARYKKKTAFFKVLGCQKPLGLWVFLHCRLGV